MVKVKYLWESHTYISIDWVKKKVLNWEIIEVPKDKIKLFITNWFEKIWFEAISELQEKIEILERESINDENALNINISNIENELFNKIQKLESDFKDIEKQRQTKIKSLKDKLKNITK